MLKMTAITGNRTVRWKEGRCAPRISGEIGVGDGIETETEIVTVIAVENGNGNDVVIGIVMTMMTRFCSMAVRVRWPFGV